MHLVVVGQSGQLARALAAATLPGPDWRLTCIGRPELDISERQNVEATLAALAPDLVINAAAYTAVDKAESEPDAAFAVNRDGAQYVSAASAELGAPVIHLSTDYVFSGESDRPWRETDPVAPLGAYGQSKLAGEQAVANANPRHLILRTAWVHSPWGGNFVKTMLRLGGERSELGVVGDQTGTPTYAPDLAGAIVSIAGHCTQRPEGWQNWGLYHLTNSGATTWHGFAAEIFRIASVHGAKTPNLKKISGADYPTPAQRPHYSVLDNSRISEAFGLHMRPWQLGAKDCVDALLSDS